ncbi:meiosis expressed gene 1 protein homolog [Notolabrus celidotus]|uniref:meiosis expressed gene 1 protein homolog n=1 Tax=Notolabrus celidotus TaxID=1203425 RepID=UPI00149055EF|nr:meiosis expressed gene 1 protein homolog [Notolabrus celidotus]
MSCTTNKNSKPKSMSMAKGWTAEVENLFRFQQAGYRDEMEYIQVKHGALVDKWPGTGFVKKLQRRDDTFYYYSRKRECEERDVNKVIIYTY